MKNLCLLLLAGLLACGVLVGSKSAYAAAGSLDASFGAGGVTVTTLTTASVNNGITPYYIVLQADGKILVLVNVENSKGLKTHVLRYTATGKLDKTFGTKGIATLPTTLQIFETMALQPNGQIVAAGRATAPSNGAAVFGVERLNANGTPDTSFGSEGLAIASLGFTGTEAVLLIQSSGDILLCGQLEPTGRGQPFHTALARFTSSGALDSTFGSGGTVNVTAVGGCSALALLSTGEIQVVNGQVIAQFTADGSLESTVTGGTLSASAGSNAPSIPSLFQPNGDYLYASPLFVGEESRAHNASVQVLRFTGTGGADSTFADPSFHFEGTGGDGIEAIPNALAVQTDGDIVVVGVQTTSTQSGTTNVNGLARLTPSGALDPTFGSGGVVANSVPSGTEGLYAVIIDAQGRIDTVGIANSNTAVFVSRYLSE
jgi:uncharacterized delta-60 repeat protein